MGVESWKILEMLPRASQVEVLPELLLPGEAESPVQTLTAGAGPGAHGDALQTVDRSSAPGVWATCAQGHGLCVGISGTPVCAAAWLH